MTARGLAYCWAAPTTLLGLLAALAACHRGGISVVDGVVEARGPLLSWGLRCLVPLPGGAAAITLGHVVLGRDQAALDQTRAHERIHVAQYERWGPLFVPAYLAASAWIAIRGGDPYIDNPFEREASRGEWLARGEAVSVEGPAAGLLPRRPRPRP